MKEYIVKVYDDRTEWFKMSDGNKYHREDGPAVVYVDGDESWYINGLLHREDGPARTTKKFKVWHKNGKLHRADGPAIVYANGDKEWWIDGRLHREDGPAMDYKEQKCWCLNGVEYYEQEFIEKTKKDSCDGKTVEIDGKKYQLKLIEE